MLPYIAEFIGTAMLILLGDGVVANVTLNKSGMKGAGSIQITLAWGLAVMVPAFIFGAASGAHFNPALTIALDIPEIEGIQMESGSRLYRCTVCRRFCRCLSGIHSVQRSVRCNRITCNQTGCILNRSLCSQHAS